MAHRFSKEDLDEQFEQFLKESLSDDSLGNEPKKKSSIPETIGPAKKKQSLPWWISEDDSDDGKHGTNGSFLKSRRLSHSIVEVDEDHVEGIQSCQPSGVSASLSRDSLETNGSVVASGPKENVLEVGLDTLEEQEEKERFFADLEKGASSTIDYSRLNKELDSNDSEVLQAFLRHHPKVNQVEEGNEDEPKNHEKSGDYSEDFEDNSESDQDSNVEQHVMPESNEKKIGMLAKVALLDSQDSALETQKASENQDNILTEHHLPKEAIAENMSGTGISCGQTNSDIEALHQAYCHVEQSLGDTDEQKNNADKMDAAENLINEVTQNKEDCPPNTSNTDSDLPTIEELMKPIKADSSITRGYDLEPLSSPKVTHANTDESVSHFPFKEHHNSISYPEKTNVGPLNHHSGQEKVSLQPVVKEDSEDTLTQRADKNKLTDRVKQDTRIHDTLPNSSALHQDNKLNEIHHPSTWNKEGLSSVLNKQLIHKNAKNTVVIHRKKSLSGPYSSVRSSGYGKSSSSLKHFSVVHEKTGKEGPQKSVLKGRSPLKQKETSGTKVIQPTKDPVSMKRNYCAAPGQSSASSIQEQVKENVSFIHNHSVASYYLPQNSERELYLLKRIQEAEEKLASAQNLIQHLKATSLEKEKEMETKILELKMQQDKNLFELNKEKYVLQTQLNHRENQNKETKWSNIWERIPTEGEMLKEIQKEVENQEMLLQGYQQENERLYNQVKELQQNNKKNEENMFKENQYLMTELASLREQVDKNNLLSYGAQNAEPAGNQNLTDLLSELRTAKAIETSLLEERKRLKQEKQALEVDLGQVKKERDLARAQISAISAEKLYEMKLMEESHKDEISRLQKRLQWYAENQELLDRDAARLRGAKEEIDKLKLEVDKLRSETGSQPTQQKKRLKDRAADAARIQDLERQVKEMEGILKRRHPNSLPALIYAAATAACEGDGDASAKTNTAEFLERRVKKLEAELEGKDDEAKKSLRAMEQQFQKIKLQYEKRIEELEQLLAYKLPNEPRKLEDSTTTLQEALEKELCNVNEAHQMTVNNLQAEIDSLRSQIGELERQKNATDNAELQSLEHQVEQAHAKAKMVRLNQEVIAKNREIQDLTKTIERLQKERRIMLSDKNSPGKADNKGKLSGILKRDPRNTRNEEFFPATLDDKIYKPDAFADCHVSEVLQENMQLKNELEKLTLEMSQQRVSSQAAIANSESLVRRAKEDSEEYISALKASHQKELEKILCQHALEHSTSKVAELNSKISTQEILIKHLQQQVHEFRRDREALAVSQKREEILQKEMAKLLEELGEARERQAPEMKHFVCLERKIKQLETRYDQREQELQQVIQETRHIAEVEQIQETEKWRQLALLKNQELEKFRIELDSMLDVLRQLQKQGVIIPIHSSNVSENYWKI
ncbi:centrosomal protein of 162 kDa isoform X2 [Anolis carolinensis]|uniref:centrosomal protein of 162 kDa isoform X2 n=1 Tax=Anolis carolinensis TaxID=28377 RepID=UPI002F2B8649